MENFLKLLDDIVELFRRFCFLALKYTFFNEKKLLGVSF